MTNIRITVGAVSVDVELLDTPTADAIAAPLPITASALTWGEEVYFHMGVEATLETNATDVVDPGTVCYWVQGSCLALPYGRTPASSGDECRLATAVNIVGKLQGDPRALAGIDAGDSVTVSIAP